MVPDIYQKASISGGWITLDTDLKKGERVRLIGETEQALHEILEVRDGAFRTTYAGTGEEVFVNGREVDDFRTVDYEAIAMLNVSATQELHRQLQAAQSELAAKTTAISALEGRLAILEARDKKRDAKFAKLEELLLSAGPDVTPVSLELTSAP